MVSDTRRDATTVLALAARTRIGPSPGTTRLPAHTRPRPTKSRRLSPNLSSRTCHCARGGAPGLHTCSAGVLERRPRDTPRSRDAAGSRSRVSRAVGPRPRRPARAALVHADRRPPGARRSTSVAFTRRRGSPGRECSDRSLAVRAMRRTRGAGHRHHERSLLREPTDPDRRTATGDVQAGSTVHHSRIGERSAPGTRAVNGVRSAASSVRGRPAGRPRGVARGRAGVLAGSAGSRRDV